MQSAWINNLSCIFIFTLFLTITASVYAQNEGDADLEEAFNLKISATSTRDLDKVAGLCESAIEKGLDEEGIAEAQQLWTSAWYEYADQMGKQIFIPGQQDRRWRVYRREALTRLKKVVELSPDMSDAYLLIARLNGLEGGDKEAANAAIEKAIEKITDDDAKLSQALFIRASLSDNDESRLADLNQAIKIDPNNLDAIRIRGAYYLQHNQADKAIDDFKLWLDNDKENLAAYYVVAQSLMAMQKFDDAIDILNKAVEVNPEESRSYKERARVFMAQEKQDKAVEDFGKAIKLNRKDFEAMMLRASILLDQEKLDEALDDVNDALELQPGLIGAYRLRSFIYSAKDNYEKAIEDIQTLSDDDPSNLSFKTQLAMLYNANDQPSKSVKIYTPLIDTLTKDLESPANDAQQEALETLLSSALRGRGDAYLSLSKHKDAIDDYEEALELSPEDDGVLNNLAWVLATTPKDDLRDGQRSVDYALSACKLTDYKEAHVLSTLASGYAEMGDFEKAREWATKAVELAGSKQQKENLSKELESYKNDKPWREDQNVEVKEDDKKEDDKKEDDKKEDDKKDGSLLF